MRHDRWGDAEARMRELSAIYRRLAKADPDNPARPRDVIDSDRRLAMMLVSLKKTEEAGAILTRAAEDADALTDKTSVPARELHARLKYTIAGYHDARKVYPKAVTAYLAAEAEYEALAGQFPRVPLYRYTQASLLYSLANPTSMTGDTKGAVAHLEKSEKLLADLTRQYPDDTGYRDLHTRVSNLLKNIRTPPKPPDKKP
jgi:tetratricopeptide (TPR) repeat protein